MYVSQIENKMQIDAHNNNRLCLHNFLLWLLIPIIWHHLFRFTFPKFRVQIHFDSAIIKKRMKINNTKTSIRILHQYE